MNSSFRLCLLGAKNINIHIASEFRPHADLYHIYEGFSCVFIPSSKVGVYTCICKNKEVGFCYNNRGRCLLYRTMRFIPTIVYLLKVLYIKHKNFDTVCISVIAYKDAIHMYAFCYVIIKIVSQ